MVPEHGAERRAEPPTIRIASASIEQERKAFDADEGEVDAYSAPARPVMKAEVTKANSL